MRNFSFQLFFLMMPVWIIGCLSSCDSGEDGPHVAVENITLGSDMLLIGEGESTALTAHISPADATNQELSWESSDHSVATVSADGVVQALAPGEAVVTATTQEGGLRASCTVYVVRQLPDAGENPHKGRTVLVYIAGDNNLASFAKADVEEMKKGMASVASASMHLLVYADYGGGDASLTELVNDNGQVAERVIKEYGERNSTGVAETWEVFEDVFANPDYQAASYGLVYWSHCDGWIPYPVPSASTRWVGQDWSAGDSRMNLADFVQILDHAPHFDFLMFDACFMQSVEVAYALRGYADYYVASPTETPGPGAPYDRILPYMFMEGEAVKMAQAYYEAYADNYDDGRGLSNDNWTAGASICVLKTAGLDDLALLTRQLLPQAEGNVAGLRAEVFSYDRRSSSSKVGYYDLQGMMQTLLPEADYAQWKQGFDRVVAYWNTTPKNYSSTGGMFSMDGAHGVSHYVPASVTSKAAEAYRSTAWYQAAGLERLGW